MEQKKLNRNSLSEQVQDVLVERIISGYYSSGERLKELKIADELGTSQAPVREAFRILQAQGYLEHQPHAGSRVKAFSFKELIEVYQAREALETYAIRLAAPRLREKIDELEEILGFMLKAAETNDRVIYSEHNTRMHRLIVECTGNQTLVKLWDSLAIKSRVLNTMFKTALGSKEAARLHPPLVEAIRKGDVEECVVRLAEHYEVISRYHKSQADQAE